MTHDTIPAGWTSRLAPAIAAAVREYAPAIGESPVILFAVDCHPWNGSLGLSVLTAAEATADPLLADPDEMAAWRHFDFAAELAGGNAADRLTDLGREMRTAYEAAILDHAAIAESYFRACAAVVVRPEVTEALRLLRQATGFRVSVPHPDTGHEYVGAADSST